MATRRSKTGLQLVAHGPNRGTSAFVVTRTGGGAWWYGLVLMRDAIEGIAVYMDNAFAISRDGEGVWGGHTANPGYQVTARSAIAARMKAVTTGAAVTHGAWYVVERSGVQAYSFGIESSTVEFRLTTIDGITYPSAAQRPFSVSSGGNIAFMGAPNWGNGILVAYLGNAAFAPTANPVGGGLLWCEFGSLRWRGSSGTVTILAPA